MSLVNCNHTMRKSPNYFPPYHTNWPFWEQSPEPTPYEINKYRLWKCDCDHWSSLIGLVAEYS